MLGDDAPRPSEGEGYRVCAGDRHVLLGEGEVVIGRSSYCSLILDHDTLSRVHASLKVEGDGVELADLGSSNGTFVNGARIGAPVRVTRSDDIRLGHLRMWLEVARAAAPVETGKFSSLTDTDAAGSVRGRRLRS
jgi:pSer/pThr/pTyr-binding forkhead associated (FHA) protein